LKLGGGVLNDWRDGFEEFQEFQGFQRFQKAWFKGIAVGIDLAWGESAGEIHYDVNLRNNQK